MTRATGRPYAAAARHGRAALVVLAVALAWTLPVAAAAPHKAHAKGIPHARHAAQKSTKPAKSQGAERLSLSDEFDRAGLIEQMLAECRGIPYNAYELAQTSGEALMLPAPIQLMTVRVRHPYCAELMRTYAPKSRV